MQIRAIATTTEPLDIRAAMQSPEVRSVARLLARADIEPPTERKFELADIDAKLKLSNLSIQERIAMKVALTRAKLL